MRTCQNCGATLADNAQYCMQCGTPADAAPPSTGETPPPTAAFLGPAAISGTGMGILATIPFVSCLCCAWFLGGGALAAWLVGKKMPAGPRSLSYGDGAFAGVLAGVWGAAVATLTSIPIRMLSAESIAQAREQIETALGQNPEVPGWIQELIRSLLTQELTPVNILIGLFISLVIYGLFAMIGGVLLVAVLRKPRT